MVVVNDGGDPGVIDKLAAQYKGSAGQIKVIHNQASKGRWRAANQGIEATNSKYVILLDDDDSWKPALLETAVNYLETTKQKGAVARCERIIEKIDGSKVTTVKKEPFLGDVTGISLYKLLYHNQLPTTSFLYKREIYDEIGYYDDSLEVLADWDFNVRFLRRYDIAFIDEVLAHVHHREHASTEGLYTNTVIHRIDVHKKIRTQLLNRYLRQDFDERRLGVGFIANSQESHYETLAALRAQIDVTNNQLYGITDSVNRQLAEIRAENATYFKKTTKQLRDYFVPFDYRLRQYTKVLPRRLKRKVNRTIRSRKNGKS